MADISDMTKSAIAVVALAAMVLVGLAVITGFEESLRDSTDANNVTVITTLGAVNTSSSLSTTYPWAQSITSCVNGTGTVIYPANYTFYPGVAGNVGVGYVVLNDAGAEFVGSGMNCTITYLADTDESDAAELFITGLTVFATFMGVIVLALIGMIVISLFKKKD